MTPSTIFKLIIALCVSVLSFGCERQKDDDYAKLRSQLAQANRRIRTLESSLGKQKKELADVRTRISELEYDLGDGSEIMALLVEELGFLSKDVDTTRASGKTVRSKLEETEAETTKLADDFAEAGNLLAERQERLLAALEVQWEQMILALETILSQTGDEGVMLRVERNLIDAGQRIQQILDGEENAEEVPQPER